MERSQVKSLMYSFQDGLKNWNSFPENTFFCILHEKNNKTAFIFFSVLFWVQSNIPAEKFGQHLAITSVFPLYFFTSFVSF